MPVTPARAQRSTIDRRVTKTRRTLREALLRLILDRGWDAVSILDVCRHADVGRSTFYSHFADKEDLLLSGFDDLHELLVAAPPAPGALGFVHGLVHHVNDNKRLWRVLVRRRSGQIVQNRVRALVLDLTRVGLAGSGIQPSRVEPVSRFIAGAIIELIAGALEHSPAIDAEELWSTFESLAAPLIAGARELGPTAPNAVAGARRAKTPSLDVPAFKCPFHAGLS